MKHPYRRHNLEAFIRRNPPELLTAIRKVSDGQPLTQEERRAYFAWHEHWEDHLMTPIEHVRIPGAA